MNLNEAGMSYRRSAIEGAGTIGLMIALFDTLAGDLRRAAAAVRSKNIEARCNELNHATLVLGQLESWLDMKSGGEAAQTLARFYAYLRAKMMEAAVTESSKLLESQTEMVLHVRSAWQRLDALPIKEPNSAVGAQPEADDSSPAQPQDPGAARIPFSQSA
jgi:flagellar biosynthetic protein FliS